MMSSATRPGQWPIAAHVTHTAMGDMLALADRAEAVGFDLLIVAPPYMVTRTEAQVVEWVRRLAEHTPLPSCSTTRPSSVS